MLLPVLLVLLLGQCTVLSGQGWHKYYTYEVLSHYTTAFHSIDVSPDSGIVLALNETWIYNGQIKSTSREFKIDPDGTILWSNWYIDSLLKRRNSCIISTEDDGCLVVGEQYYFDSISVISETYFTKYDQGGKVEWDSAYSKTPIRSGDAVETPDGGYLLISNAQNSEAYVMKVDSLGKFLRDKYYSDRDYYVYEVLVNNANSCTLVGRSKDTLTNRTVGLLMTIDANGTLWSFSFVYFII